ncbi:hypothetical protein BDV96DRAFT_505843 [Lophiotrema nucula]|uniref:BZIP domain-containing protein n=1 Tax=Lophiotrema nucula TaxID=690887 RepID=A0A6A5YL62_9PLEO|nr:hypothetical protein BDV96DRAFT_505843 [Lophiotrema nucula]
MEVEQPGFDWAHDTFVALNDMDLNPTEGKWPPFNSDQAQAFSVPPSLLTTAVVERFGQITPPEELSPADPRRDSGFREGSIPVEDLQNEVSWPMQHPLHSIEQFNHTSQQNEQQPSSQSKKRRVSKDQPSTNGNGAAPHSLAKTTTDPAPPKRKRGRPKAQPQVVEAYTQDGVPFQVTSARQNHLEKNRVAAHKCRQRKKVYIEGLEGRAREFSAKNKILKDNVAQLREEVLELKNEVLRHAGCGFWAVDEYLARCAGDLLGMGPASALAPQKQSQPSPTLSSLEASKPSDRESSLGSSPSDGFLDLDGKDDFGGLELLEHIDEDKDNDSDD